MKSMTCLIIDDSPIILQTTHILLKHEGIQSIEADNGQSGLSMALEHHPDFILLDIMMPGMDGFEVLEHLKENPDTASIPVIVFTATDSTTLNNPIIAKTGVQILRKPFHLGDLMRILEKLPLGNSL